MKKRVTVENLAYTIENTSKTLRVLNKTVDNLSATVTGIVNMLEHITATMATKADVEELAMKTARGFNEVDQRFVALETKMNKHFETIEETMSDINENNGRRFRVLEQRFDTFEYSIVKTFVPRKELEEFITKNALLA